MQPVANLSHRLDLGIHRLVSCCYNGNIHVETMQTQTSASYIAAYELTFQHWSRYGSIPSFVRLDYETSKELKNFLRMTRWLIFSISLPEEPFHCNPSNDISEVSYITVA